MEGAIGGHPGKAITMKRRQGGSVGPAECFGAQITQPIGTKLAAFPIGSRQPSLLLFGTMAVFPIRFPAGEPITTARSREFKVVIHSEKDGWAKVDLHY